MVHVPTNIQQQLKKKMIYIRVKILNVFYVCMYVPHTCEKIVLHDVCTFPRDNKNECRPVVCSTAKPLG